MITARRLLFRAFLKSGFSYARLQAGFCTMEAQKASTPPKESQMGIFGSPTVEKPASNRNLEAALRFSKEDHPSRAIQELQVVARYYNDLYELNKKPGFTQKFEIVQKVKETLHYLYRSSSFNSLEFPSLLDSLARFQKNGLLSFDAVIATIQFSADNIEEVKRLAFETSNFRVVYHLLTLLWRIGNVKPLMLKPHNALLSKLREELVTSLIALEITDSLQVYESINLMITVLATQQWAGENSEQTTNLVYKIIENVFPKATDQSQLVLLMVILCRLPYQKPELVSAMASTFDAMGQDKNRRIVLAHFRELQIEYLFLNMSALQEVFPDQLMTILAKVKGYLPHNVEVTVVLLDNLLTKDDKLLYMLINDELDSMIKLNMFATVREEKRLLLLCKACMTLSKTQSFTNFSTRDKLLDLFAQALLECELKKVDINYVNEYLYLMVNLRFGSSISILKIADRILDKLSKEKSDRLLHLKLLSGFASAEVISGTHPVLDELALKTVSIPDLSQIVLHTFQFRTLLNAVEKWHYKLWKELQTSPAVRVPPSFGMLIDKMLELFNQYMQQKVKFDSKTINKIAHTFDSLLAFGYFDESPPMKAKIEALVLKLASISTEHSVFDDTHMSFYQISTTDRYGNAEEIFKERLKAKGIKFETEKLISTTLVDFYLPEYNVAVELDGIIHFSRSLRREHTLKTLLKKDFLRAKGVNLYNFTTVDKYERDKLEARFAKLIDLIIEDYKAGIIRTSNEDPTSTN